MAAVQSEQAAPVGVNPEEEAPPQKLEGEALIQALTAQLEFYFSRQNLATDAYLLSQMNQQKYVAVDVIAAFPKVKAMTEDKELLIKVMRQCKGLNTNEEGTMVRPNLKMERNTLILRDIASTTPEEEVKGIFSAEGCGKVVNIRSDIGDTWFVTFESEDICMDTCMALTSMTFKGAPIRCRVKSENLLRGFYYPMGGPPGGKPAQDSRGGGWRGPPNGGYYGGQMGQGYMGQPYGAYNNMGPQHYGQWQGYQQQGGSNTPPNGQGQQRANERGAGRGRRSGAADQAPGPKQGRGRKGQATTPKGGVAGAPGAQQAAGKAGKGRKAGARKGSEQSGAVPQGAGAQKQAGQKNKRTAGKGAAAQPQLGPDDFPALPTAQGKPAPSVGYQTEFLKYTRDTMASVVEKLCSDGFPIPGTFPQDDSTVISATALEDSQLMEPFPVMYPASPSPLFAAQAHHSSDIPFLDLNMMNPYLPPDVSDVPMSQMVGSGVKKAAKGKGEAVRRQSKSGKDGSKASRKSATGGKGAPKYAQKASAKGERKRKNSYTTKGKAADKPAAAKPAAKFSAAPAATGTPAAAPSSTAISAAQQKMVWVTVTGKGKGKGNAEATKEKASKPAKAASSGSSSSPAAAAASTAPAKAQSQTSGPVTGAAIVAGKANKASNTVWGKPAQPASGSTSSSGKSEKSAASAASQGKSKKAVKQLSTKQEAQAQQAKPVKSAPNTPSKFSYADMIRKKS